MPIDNARICVIVMVTHSASRDVRTLSAVCCLLSLHTAHCTLPSTVIRHGCTYYPHLWPVEERRGTRFTLRGLCCEPLLRRLDHIRQPSACTVRQSRPL